MTEVWIVYLAVIVLLFAAIETFAIRTGRETLSMFIWRLCKAWPPTGWLIGVVVGFLAAHFFWPNQGP